MTINSVNRNTDYVLTTKATRSFFRWKALGENNSAVPGETAKLINSTAFLNLVVKYIWTDSNSCYLELGWEPWHLNEDNQLVRFNDTDNYFSQEGLGSDSVYLTINGEPCLNINSLIPNTSPNTCRMIDLEENDTYIPIKCYEITGIEGTNNLNIEYYYEYTDTNTDIKYYVDLTGKKGLKIPKVGKYDDNIIFNKDGLNELIDNIKKYPVIDIETVPAEQWSDVSEGQPSIKIIHGNPEYDDENHHNYKYVKVGSNIIFEDSQEIILNYIETADTQLDSNFNYCYRDNESYIPIETQEELSAAINNGKTIYKKSIDQKPGSFRVNINTDTYEVPVKDIKNSVDTLIENATEQINTSLAAALDQLTPPILIKNQKIVISGPSRIIQFNIPSNIVLNENSIIFVTPKIGDLPNLDLISLTGKTEEQIEEIKAEMPSSWDLWGSYSIICEQDSQDPNIVYFYLSEEVGVPTDVPEGVLAERKIYVDFMILKNGIDFASILSGNQNTGD